jgi:hypothetical protein
VRSSESCSSHRGRAQSRSGRNRDHRFAHDFSLLSEELFS